MEKLDKCDFEAFLRRFIGKRPKDELKKSALWWFVDGTGFDLFENQEAWIETWETIKKRIDAALKRLTAKRNGAKTGRKTKK